MNKEFHENDFATYHFEDQILVITFKKKHGTLPATIKIIADKILFINDKKHLILADVRAIAGTTKEALNYFDTEKSTKGVVATAILTESFISRFTANIFIRLNTFKTKVPTKIFNEKIAAIKWLKQKDFKIGS